jgi:hypothetical protein
MKRRAPGAWITLNASYYAAPVCHPDKFMDDAIMLFNGARGIAQSLSGLLEKNGTINADDLAKALWSASVLIQMGQRSAEEAYGRVRKIQNRMRNGDGVE